MAKAATVKKPMTKSELLNELAESTGLSRKQIGAVLDGLSDVIERHIKKRGPGQFTLPGLLKIKAVKKKATPAKKGVPNPFRPGETMDIAAKPASVRVRVTPLKKMKDMAQ